MIKISPSVLAADFANLESEISKIEETADALHLDIMDGAFVPNISFGIPVVKAIRRITKLPLDVHLMIENPANYLEEFALAGADYITVHAEACKHLNRTISKIKKLGCKAGVSLNPHTSETCLKYLLKEVDLILVMSVNPGYGGQSFIEEMLIKIKNIKDMLERENEEAIIAVDGGINQQNIQRVYQAGSKFIIAGSAVFKQKDPAKAIIELKKSVK